MGSIVSGWVTCNICEHGIKIAPEVKPTEGGGERVTFSCAHCGHVYLIAQTSKRGLQARANLKRILVKLKRPRLKTSKRVRLQGQADRWREILAVEVQGATDLARGPACL